MNGKRRGKRLPDHESEYIPIPMTYQGDPSHFFDVVRDGILKLLCPYSNRSHCVKLQM
jgi:hypothetical protein